MNLRKEKAARLKLAILDHTLKLIGKKPFDDVHVDDICAKVKISKVTLFKYFPQKEDILLYFFRLWCLKRAIEFKEKPREGLSAVFYLFDKLAEDYETYPGLILSWVAYQADLKRAPKPFPVKPEERRFLFPQVADVSAIELLSLDQMFEKAALEAIFKKEITKTTNTREVMFLLNTVFYGSVLTSHLNQVSQPKMFFKRNVELLMKGMT
jgi:AcrR family transcriptional regulator